MDRTELDALVSFTSALPVVCGRGWSSPARDERRAGRRVLRAFLCGGARLPGAVSGVAGFAGMRD